MSEPISAIAKVERDERLRCRFYEAEFPEENECVMVQVESIQEMGAYVRLLEYNFIEGMILLSELSRRRIRSINKLVRVGKLEVAMVIRVDKEKGYIDLSKRRVSPEDIVKCEERFNKGKTVHSIMRNLAETNEKSLLELNKQIAWPLDKAPYKCTFDAFRISIMDPDSVFGALSIEEGILDQLLKVIRRKLTPQPIRIRADIEVVCYAYSGIEAIRAALVAGQEAGTEETPIVIKLIAPPKYVMLATTLDKQAGFDLLVKSIDAITKVIKDYGGNLNVAAEPHVTSSDEDNALHNMMERLEMENSEQFEDGDEDGEELEEED